jgi:hypothetical protein
VSDIVFIGDTKETKDSEVVDNELIVIEKLIGDGRFSCLVGEFLAWEDIKKDFNGISDGMVGTLG